MCRSGRAAQIWYCLHSGQSRDKAVFTCVRNTPKYVKRVFLFWLLLLRSVFLWIRSVIVRRDKVLSFWLRSDELHLSLSGQHWFTGDVSCVGKYESRELRVCVREVARVIFNTRQFEIRRSGFERFTASTQFISLCVCVSVWEKAVGVVLLHHYDDKVLWCYITPQLLERRSPHWVFLLLLP